MKRVIRGFCSGLSFLLFGIGSIIISTTVTPVIIIISMFYKNQRYFMAHTIRYSWVILVKIMSGLSIIKVRVRELEKLKKLQGTIIVANHPSLIDVVILVSIIPNPICIVKSEISKNPFMKYFALRAYICNNKNAEQFLKETAMVLKEGYNLIIFPEGTRTMPGKTHKLHRGAAHISMHSGAPMLPLRINQSEQVLGKGQPFYDVSNKRIIYEIVPKDIIKPPKGYNLKNIRAKQIMDAVKTRIEI